MGHKVYANNNNIASKSSGGKSAVATPDVCFTAPRLPNAGLPQGTPIPYPNTCEASKITKGSKSVVIANKEIALENKSYFKTSLGDNPATKAAGKGIVTGKVNDKCYFRNWSQNVKVEGKGVCRHIDMVTHNHTNTTNTPPYPFIEGYEPAEKACKKDVKKMKKACRQRKKHQQKCAEKFKEEYKKKHGKSPSKKEVNEAVKHRSWLAECKKAGLMHKPKSTNNPDMDATEKNNLENIYRDLATYNDLSVRKALNNKLDSTPKRLDVSLKQLNKKTKKLTKSLAKLKQNEQRLQNKIQQSNNQSTLAQDKKNLQNIRKKIETDEKDLNETKSERNKRCQRAHARDMQDKANKNACIKARRCILVPYKNTDKRKKEGKKASEQGHGCCPGQTAHHIMPRSMFIGAIIKNNKFVVRKDGKKTYKKFCKGYNYRDAPTICVEGINQYHGSHGEVHNQLDEFIEKFLKIRKSWQKSARRKLDRLTNKGNTQSLEDKETINGIKDFMERLKKHNVNNTLTYNEAREAGIESVMATIGDDCNKKCLRAQLDNFHVKTCKCKSSPLRAASGK